MWVRLCLLNYAVVGMFRSGAINVSRRCGLPVGYDKLPRFAREELLNIWDDYKSGTDCAAQQIATNDILAVVDVFSAKYHNSDLRGATSLLLSTTGQPLIRQITEFPISYTSNPYPISYASDQNSLRDQEEQYSESAASFIAKPYRTSDSTRRYSTRRYVTPFQELNSGMVPLKAYETGNESQNDLRTEDPTYGLVYTAASADRSPTSNPEVNSAIDNNRYVYNAVSSYISPASENESVYDDELPTSETSQLPEFLSDANEDVINSFLKVWNDPDIPSEGLRQERIHLLAVSLLTTKQLSAYNKYAREHRRCQQQLLFQKYQLSAGAQQALNILIHSEAQARYELAKNFPYGIRRELRDFVRRRAGKHH